MFTIKPLTDYRRIVLLTDGASTPFLAKTAISMLRYRTQDVVAILDRSQSGMTAQELFGCGGSIPVIDSLDNVDEVEALLIGIAPPGGCFPEGWREIILAAIHNRVDIISGLHQFLSRDAEFTAAARVSGAHLVDVRKNEFQAMPSLTELNPDCYRVLTVGQDCSVGKMVTSIEIQRGLLSRGRTASFAATGQTGIMISGSGLPIDCVVADFVNAAAERVVLDNQGTEYLLIEGQGSIAHPAYSAVTAGLLHGSAPDALVLCYEATRREVKGFPRFPLTSLADLRNTYEQFACLRHPCRVIGVSMNSRLLDEEQFKAEKTRVANELRLPVCDVYREGPEVLVDAVIAASNRSKT